MNARSIDIFDRNHEVSKIRRIVVVIVAGRSRNFIKYFMDANDDEHNNPTTERPCETRRSNNSNKTGWLVGWLVGLVGWLVGSLLALEREERRKEEKKASKKGRKGECEKGRMGGREQGRKKGRM